MHPAGVVNFLVIHGANVDANGCARLQAELSTAAELRMPRTDGFVFTVPDWRQQAGFTLGNYWLTLPEWWTRPPRSSAQARLPLRELVARLIARAGNTSNALTDVGVTHRLDIYDFVSGQLLGDVLSYWRRRLEVHEVLTKALAGLEGPVVAVGHSLGGIALVDFLASEKPEKVCALVTYGTQASLMFALDALAGLPWGGPAKPFSPWLNVWDRRDQLSFLAGDVVRAKGSSSVVCDIETASGQSMRLAHSAYLTRPGLWATLELAADNCSDADRWPIPSARVDEATAKELARLSYAGDSATYRARVDELERREIAGAPGAGAATIAPFDDTEIRLLELQNRRNAARLARTR